MSTYDAKKYTWEQIESLPPPSKDPKSREALQLAVCFKDNGELYYCPYKRINKKIHFDAVQATSEDERNKIVGGWVNDLFPKNL